MAPYLELAARDRDHSACSCRKRKIEPQQEAGEGHFLRVSFTVRSFIMSVALRARDARGVTPSYSPRVGKWSHEKSKAKKTRRFCLVFDYKKGAFGIGAVRHRFFARRLRGAVGAVRASSTQGKGVQTSSRKPHMSECCLDGPSRRRLDEKNAQAPSGRSR